MPDVSWRYNRSVIFSAKMWGWMAKIVTACIPDITKYFKSASTEFCRHQNEQPWVISKLLNVSRRWYCSVIFSAITWSWMAKISLHAFKTLPIMYRVSLKSFVGIRTSNQKLFKNWKTPVDSMKKKLNFRHNPMRIHTNFKTKDVNDRYH